MTDAPPKKILSSWLILLTAVLAPFLVASCSSTPKIQGLPDKLPDIALNGSSATPPHNLPNYEYPFDANGNYVSNWAAEGERRAGRPAMATNEDERKWSGSHRGHATGKSPKKSTSKKGSGKSSGSGKSKKKSSPDDDDVKPKSKSGSGSKSKSSSSSSKKKSSTSKSGGSGSGSKSGTAKKKSSGSGSSDKPNSKSGTKSSSSKKKKKSDD